jgi:CheY-like chemotaxis protein
MGRPMVVIVDDDTDFLEEMEDMLTASGYDVKTVSHPLRAVRIIEETMPQAVLLDLRMDEKDGFEIARELSANPVTKGVPVIVLTGYYDEAELEPLQRSGAIVSYLTKPLLVPDLMAKLDKIRGPV